MHRQDLLNMLRAYRDRYPDEAACVDRYVAFVEAHADCFERSQQAGHVTGSAWVVSAAGDEVLLTHHRKLDKWLQFGGHADGQADVLEVALREAREESGLTNLEPVWPEIFDLDIHLIPARKSDPDHYHYDARFALRATGDEPFVVSDESHELAWVRLDELEKYTIEPSMLRMRDKWLATVGGKAQPGGDGDAPAGEMRTVQADAEQQDHDEDEPGAELPVASAFALFSLIAGGVVLARALRSGDGVHIAMGAAGVLLGLAIALFGVLPAWRERRRQRG